MTIMTEIITPSSVVSDATISEGHSCNTTPPMASDTYQELSRDEAVQIVDGAIHHAAHVMLYARVDEKLFDCYDVKYAILMQVRFDGTLGFPGGYVDKGETPEGAVNREMCEELGCSSGVCIILETDHVMSQVSYKTQFCLHFYAKEISLATLQQMERSVIACKEYGSEVMGTVRCPLYTLPNGLGFPAFLQHQYIGTSRTQLVQAIWRRGLLTANEIETALELKPPTSMDDDDSYEMISREQSLTSMDHVTHDCRAVLYAPVTSKLFGKYDMSYTVMVQMRYDGTMGFPGGIVNKGETPEMAINRRIFKEHGCTWDKFAVTPIDHLFSKISHDLKHGNRFCFHSYAKEISLETLRQLEKSSLAGNEYGLEVLGVIRCPLYTLPNGLGFPAFLKHHFITDSKDHLLHAIKERKLLSQSELKAVIKNCDHVKTLVTVQDADV